MLPIQLALLEDLGMMLARLAQTADLVTINKI